MPKDLIDLSEFDNFSQDLTNEFDLIEQPQLDYDFTNRSLSPTQITKLLDEYIPENKAVQVRNMGCENKQECAAVQAHRILDYIGMDTIESALADGIPLEKIVVRLRITQGRFMSWVHTDPELEERYHKAAQATLLKDALDVKRGILQSGEMSFDEVNTAKVQLAAAKDVESKVRTKQKDQDDGNGVYVQVNLGNLLG